MTKDEVTQLLLDHLKQEGYVPHVDSDGDVAFKAEGRSYFIDFNEAGELYYFRLAFPNFWSIEDEDERRRVETAACAASRDIKSAKIYPVNDNTWGSVEIYVSSPQEFLKVMMRSLNCLQGAAQVFRRTMQESAPQQ